MYINNFKSFNTIMKVQIAVVILVVAYVVTIATAQEVQPGVASLFEAVAPGDHVANQPESFVEAGEVVRNKRQFGYGGGYGGRGFGGRGFGGGYGGRGFGGGYGGRGFGGGGFGGGGFGYGR